MPIKYWEFEDAPMKEKLKHPSVSEIAKLFFENETEAYRFAYLLLEVKRKGSLRLKDIDKQHVPISTSKRYLDFAVQMGLLKHENNFYSFTDRYTRPFKNIAAYISAWVAFEANEDLDIAFPNARKSSRKNDSQLEIDSKPNAASTI